MIPAAIALCRPCSNNPNSRRLDTGHSYVCGNGFGGCSWRLAGVKDLAGDAALKAAHHFVLRFTLGNTPRHVVAGGLVAAQPHDQDDVQSSVGATVTAAFSRCRMVLPLEAQRAETAQLGECSLGGDAVWVIAHCG
jgi:hypothetical protein